MKQKTVLGDCIVLYEKMNCGDYIKVVLHQHPPVNDVDDIEIDIKGQYGRNRLLVQDWEAIVLVKGLLEAILQKHQSYEAFFKKMAKENKLVVKWEDMTICKGKKKKT